MSQGAQARARAPAEYEVKIMELLMGNEAIALGAIKAGVAVVAGYPGTPSTEVLETVAKRNPGGISVQWSVNEKSALEVGVGAAYAGARAMVTMKQVGLNVASDPLMCVNYVGVKGGLVILVADDPGPISSQTEQDTRAFGRYARIPVLDPASPEEAFAMAGYAFELSERIQGPVILRPTTRVCHSCASLDVGGLPAQPRPAEGFVKSPKWVIFPRISYQNKLRLVEREQPLSDELSACGFNAFEGEELLDIRGQLNPCDTCEVARQPYFTRNGSSECVDCERVDVAQRIAAARRGVACGGVSYAYVREALRLLGAECPILKIGTPYPFPDALARKFLSRVGSVLVFEELDPVIEDALHMARDRFGLTAQILGKRDGASILAGELSVMACAKALSAYLGVAMPQGAAVEDAPELPARPPVLCAGCPHRGSFYAVKTAMKGRRAVFCGDIGCYTLGNAAPLDMTDTCLCMGAGITIAQGLKLAGEQGVCFAFVGDSTFFHTGIPGVINAVYNKTPIVLCVLDNSTTAMTGHQAHPGMGRDASGDIAPRISIRALLSACGVSSIDEVDSLDLASAVPVIRRAAEGEGVRAIVFKSPCIALSRQHGHMAVDAARCVGCRRCISELGCPAMSIEGGKASIAADMCTACGLCAQVCPTKCIAEVE